MHMASGPPPIILPPPPSAADDVSSSLARLASPPPPSIVFEPTSDGEGSDLHSDVHSTHSDVHSDTHSDAPSSSDHRHSFYHNHNRSSSFFNPDEPFNPHAAALLRRSPSPVLLPQPPALFPLSGAAASTPSLLSPSGANLLPPHAASSRFYSRSNSNSSSSSSFLRPPGIMASSATAAAGGSSDGSASGSSDELGSGAVPIPSRAGAVTPENPFNFQTQYISTSPVKSNIGLRRGHRYKHSSISAQHQIFQEPPPRPPPVLPASLPVPTLREAWASMQRDQRARFYWCLCHAAVAVFVFLCAAEGGDSLALTALSHLVFFDVGSAAVCVAVDVLGNFEVWRRSTIRHPFGLRRAEVLAGFAMSIFLVFGGFDLLSHDLKDVLEAFAGGVHAHHGHGSGHHDHHHVDLASRMAGVAGLDSGSGAGGGVAANPGSHPRYISPGSIDVAALAAFSSTLVSAYGLGNHARIRRALLLLHGVVPSYKNVPFLSALLNKNGAGAGAGGQFLAGLSLPAVVANPFHFLTLTVSLVLLLLPLLFVAVQPWLDRLLCATIALSMLLLGARLAVAQGFMLLMSYSGKANNGTTLSTTTSTSSTSTANKRNSQMFVGDIDMSIPLQPPPPPSAAASTIATTSGSEDPKSSVSAVLSEIAAQPQVARVEDAQFWQVHYGLCMANLRVRVVRGCDDGSLRQLRQRVARVIQNRLGEGYGRGNSLRWEVTVQTSVDGL